MKSIFFPGQLSRPETVVPLAPELDSGVGLSEDDLEVDRRSGCSSFFLAMGSPVREHLVDMVLINSSQRFLVDG